MNPSTLTLRLAHAGDADAIARLVEMEEAAPLTGDVAVAESGGNIIAALSVADERVVADLFRPTAATVELLRRWRSDQISARRTTRAGALRRRRTLGFARRAEAWA